jgi:orotidine-5'-phosphate decarboxylase
VAEEIVGFAERLAAAVRQSRSVVCVGLDPRLEQLPAPIRDSLGSDSPDARAAAYLQFCSEIIDVVRGRVACVKPQAAFFEQLGPAGMVALGEVIRRAGSAGLLVILDGKRNDIGSTAEAYADAYLGPGTTSPWGSDALTVSPYLGRDSLEPLATRCDDRRAGIFILVKTSNPGGGWLQDRRSGDEPVYRAVASLVAELNQGRIGPSGYGPIGAVVGATYPDQLAELRQAMPASWILVPGYGAQGGSADDVRRALDDDGLGAVVNSSRHLIFAHRRPEFRDRYGESRWQDAVAAAVAEMNEVLSV